MSVTGRILVTVLGRRWPLAVATAAIFAGQALAIPILVLTDEPGGVVGFVVLFGLGVGLISLVRAALVADFYGLAAYASINGVLALSLTLGRAAAPVAAAGLRTATGNYRLVMAAVALCAVAASLAMLHTHRLHDRQGLHRPGSSQGGRRWRRGSLVVSGDRGSCCVTLGPRTITRPSQGAIVRDVPEVLFVCVHNAGRSQMAAALLDHHAKGKVHVRSAGSDPADRINPAVVAAMDEWGIDLSRAFPKHLTDASVRAADVVVTMGCGDACPIYPGKRYEDWELQDPAGQPVEVVRRIRDNIDARVQQLLHELVPASA
jgi:arsenate reductase (thioredoxin)